MPATVSITRIGNPEVVETIGRAIEAFSRDIPAIGK